MESTASFVSNGSRLDFCMQSVKSGESRESTFVQREEGCGKTLGMRASRLATTVKPPLALLSWSGAQERAEPWQAEVAPTRPRTWRSFSR